MTLSCDCGYEYDGDGWYWEGRSLKIMSPIKRRKRCKCCGDLINWGEEVYEFDRYCWPRSDIEESIYGEQVPLPPWYTCEECSDLISAVEDLGFCWSWGEPLSHQIAEYRAAEAKFNADQDKREWATINDYL